MSTPAFLQGILEHEQGLFCNVVGAVPEEGREHRCEPRACSAEELIGHMIGHNLDLLELLNDGVIHHRNNASFDTVEDAVSTLDRTFGEIIDRLGSIDEAAWTGGGRSSSPENISSWKRRSCRWPG